MSGRFTADDARYMRRALELAQRGEGRVEPNPMVGALIVRGGQLLGEGWHRRFGGPHAEIEALRACGWNPAGGRNERVRGAACYVTLEPCCHHGKTPPCTDALIAAGIRRVVAAVKDPNPRVAGGGFHALRRAGIRVETGLLADEARRLNAPFFKHMRTGLPWVILKWAQSLDGKIATRQGDSKWITSLESRRLAHRLRGRVDAIVVGIGTVLADDPDLTCRLARRRRTATRVVLDPRLRMPPSARLAITARNTPTLVLTRGDAPAGKRRRLESAGCEVAAVRAARAGLSLEAVLAELARRGMTNVMVEGGGRVLGGFFDAGLMDEAWVFIAPKLLGGRTATGPLHGLGLTRVAQSRVVEILERRACGADELVRLRVR